MPITPVPEKPPVNRPKNSIDWTEALAALTAQPGEWFKVDGPCKSNATQGRERSLTNPAPARRWGTDLATVTRNRRVRPALGRVVAAIAKRREAV